MDFIKKKAFYIPLITICILTIALLGIRMIINANRITSLPTPSVKAIPESLGKNVVIQGSGYPEAKVLIYQNGEFVEETDVDYGGNFSKRLVVTEEGEKIFKVRQIFKEVESLFSEEITTNIDLTPPNPESFTLDSKLNSNQTKKSLKLKGAIGSGDKLIINGKSQQVEDNGSFEFTYLLEEGNNTLKFQLMDPYSNVGSVVFEKSIFVDTKEPIIEENSWGTASCGSNQRIGDIYLEEEDENIKTEEKLVIGIGQWSGYLDSYNSVPIVGCVRGNIKSITLDGKSIKPDENGEIYQRVSLFIRGGLNKYKVVAIDELGNKATEYVETTAEKDGDSIDVNLNY